MKKLLPISSVIAVFLLSVTTIYAETTKPLIRPIKAVSIDRLKEQAESLRMKVEERKEAVATKIEDRREKVASIEARFKAFKDQRKAETATRLNENFNNVNAKVTDAMLAHLARLSDILAKISAKAETATNGAELQTSIDSAQAAITAAQTAINAQKAKTYTITSSSEANLAANARTTKQKLTSDLKALKETIVAAKEAVIKVHRELNALKEANGTAD